MVGKSKIILAVLCCLLYIPKANIINFDFSYVGLKADDIIGLLLCILIGINFYIRGRMDVIPSRISYSIFFYLFLTILFNCLYGMEFKNVAFIGRYIEYFLFLLFGYNLSKNTDEENLYTNISRVVLSAFVYWYIFSILQYMGLIGGWMKGEYIDGIVFDRTISNFSHPTELSSVVTFLLFLTVGCIDKKNKICIFIIFILVFSLFIFTESRSGILGCCISSLYFMRKRISIRKVFVYFACLFICIFFFLSLHNREWIEDNRMLNFLKMETWEYAFLQIDKIEEQKILELDVSNVNIEGDFSLNIRLMKWSVVFLQSLNTGFLIGVGAGNMGEAIDGFYVRLLGESGVLGLLLYLYSIYGLIKEYRENLFFDGLIAGTIGLFVIAIFIDVWFFSRVACLFWFLWGIALNSKKICVSGK